MMETLEFGPLLARLRASRGLSQEALAERAALSVEAISALERGTRRAPRLRTIAALADALGLGDDERSTFARSVESSKRMEAGDGISAVPVSLTTFVGREGEIEKLDAALARNRMVTIVGPAGVGKTRLATYAAGELEKDQGAPAIAFADLSAVESSDVQAMIRAIAAAANVSASEDVRALAATLNNRTLTLVVDNCEHLAPAVSEALATLLAHCRHLRILATSRHALGIAGEQRFKLEPLSEADAVGLFVERAALHDPRFDVDEESVNIVKRICARLDRLPLAIELAAPRVQLLSLEQLERRLQTRIDLPPLRAAIDWSYSLLDDHERALFAELGVFRGSFTFEAAEAVCSTDGADTLTVLQSLVDKSLVSTIIEDRTLRLHLLESLREYAVEALARSGEDEATTTRYIEYFISVAHLERSRYDTVRSTSDWMASVDPEAENLRSALRIAFAAPEHLARAVRLFTIVSDLWALHGLATEASRLAEAAADRIAHLDLAAQTDYWNTLARLRWTLLLPASALEAATHARSLAETLDDPLRLARALLGVGEAQSRMQRYDESFKTLSQAAELFASAGDRREWARTRLAIATIDQLQGRLPEARDGMIAAAATMHELGDERRVRIAQTRIAETEFAMGAVGQAIARARENLRSEGMDLDDTIRGCQQGNLASYLLAQGEIAEARELALEATSNAFLASREVHGAIALQHFAAAIAADDAPLAAQLLGFVSHTLDRAHYVREAAERYTYETLRAELTQKLDESVLRGYLQRGALMDEVWALELATKKSHALRR